MDIQFPKWLVFQLVEKCNLRCKMCYQWGDTGSYHELSGYNHLSYEVIVRTLEEMKPHKPYVGLFGGEPTLHPDFTRIIGYLGENGYNFYLDTNGTLNKKHAAQLVKNNVKRVWISLDGPPEINDRQRGKGVFARVQEGLREIVKEKAATGARSPQVGISLTVTPLNYAHTRSLFFDHLDISQLDCISIELQNFATREEHAQYAGILDGHFGRKQQAPIARGLVTDPAIFGSIQVESLIEQVSDIKELCSRHGVSFNTSLPTLTTSNFTNYFKGDWLRMDDKRTRCFFPWTYAEVTAAGDVTVCHTFYDLTFGNLNRQSLAEIWKGEELEKARKYLKKQLFPICTACCRYYYNPGSKFENAG